MIYIFVPYYGEDTTEFKKSLENQTIRYLLIKRNTKKSKILWTEAANDFYENVKSWYNKFQISDNDVIGIMNNDIFFSRYMFETAGKIKYGEVMIPQNLAYSVCWKKKSFSFDVINPNAFTGRCFFMTVRDFRESGGFCKYLPHALSDIDFALRVLKKLKLRKMDSYAGHKDHGYTKSSIWSLRNYNNPILWTIFLLKHFNKYTFLNILKAWYAAIFR